MLIAPIPKNRTPEIKGLLFLNIRIVGTKATILKTTPTIVEIYALCFRASMSILPSIEATFGSAYIPIPKNDKPAVPRVINIPIMPSTNSPVLFIIHLQFIPKLYHIPPIHSTKKAGPIKAQLKY